MIIFRFFDETCLDSYTCHTSLLDKLETETELVLQNKNQDKIVNGSLSVWHHHQGHLLKIEIYDNDEKPNNEHVSYLKKPNKTKINLLKEKLNDLPQARKPNVMLLEKLQKN
jgi:hypothetical protein